MENKTVEITVRHSHKVVLIAKLVKILPEGFIFVDEIKGNEEFMLRREDVTMMEVL